MWGRIVLGVLILFVVTACTQSTLRAEPVSEEDLQILEPELALLCGDVQCSENQVCQEESCVCAEGFKQCGDSCIPEASCCASDECGEKESCVNNACTFDCEKVTCRSNQVCDASLQRCTCPPGYKFCANQVACIPDDHCCSRFDCGIDEKCVDTVASAELCLENEGRACKLFDARRDKTLSLAGKEFRIKIENFEYTKSASLLVNSEKFNLPSEGELQLGDGFVLNAKTFRETGGSCIDSSLDRSD